MLAIFPTVTETFVAREIEALKRRGFEVVVFAIKRPLFMPSGKTLSSDETLRSCVYARPDRLLQHAFANLKAILFHPVRYFSALRVFAGAWGEMEPGAFVRLLYHFACGVGFSSEMRRHGIHHLHSHFTAGCNVALAANLFAGLPFSFTAHASGDLFVKPVLLRTKVQRAVMAVPVCDYSERFLNAAAGHGSSHKLHRIYNGVDVREPTLLAPSSADGSGTGQQIPGAIQLLSVGSLVGVKGHGTLVEVCGLLHREGFPVQCKIVGSGPEHEVLARRIQEMGLRGVVELVGLLSLGDVYQTMRAADIFVLLSEIGVNGYRDGFPTVLLEAMAIGLPVVSTWVSGIPEIVEDQITGILVPERNPSAATAAIRRLLQDPTLRSSMGSAGRERVHRLFNLERSGDELAALLSAALSGRLQAGLNA